MKPPVANKADMYRRLSSGEFGNTVPQWFDLEQWEAESPRYQWWGVRTLTPGGPCELNVHRDWVPLWVARFERDGFRCNISPMVDRLSRVRMWANVWDSPTGLVLECILNPPHGASWRKLMPTNAKTYSGITARSLLSATLNENSHDDLRILLEQYPDHVIEFSALDRCFGTVPGRNAVVWEVRRY